MGCCTEVFKHGSGASIGWLRRGAPIAVSDPEPDAIVLAFKRWLALIYGLRDEHSLVVHPQVGRTLGADPVVLPLDLMPAGVFADPQDDGEVDLLVSLYRDDNGTEKDESDDRGPFIDRYRLDP